MFKNFLDSLRSIKDLRVLCASALLVAIYVALYSVKMPLSPDLRITFTFIPIAVAGWLFGICPAIIVAVLGDILGCLWFPQGAYFPGFTLTSLLTGFVFGAFLYKKEARAMIISSIVSKTIITVFLNIILNAVWISYLQGKAVYIVMIGRIVKNLLLLPVEIILMIVLFEALSVAKIPKMYK